MFRNALASSVLGIGRCRPWLSNLGGRSPVAGSTRRGTVRTSRGALARRGHGPLLENQSRLAELELITGRGATTDGQDALEKTGDGRHRSAVPSSTG